jgi:alpha-tubulin suppressor-like RCC1 family protein
MVAVATVASIAILLAIPGAQAASVGGVLGTGYNGYGQLCNGTTNAGSTPAGAVTPLDGGVSTTAAGAVHSLALKSDGTIYACGNNLFGQLGNGTTTNSSTPVAVTLPGGVTATAVAADEFHSLALTSGGAVFAWGHNAFGQLGNGTTSDSSSPVAVAVPGTVTQIAAGWAFNLALTSTGAVYAWGFNGDGELGTTSADTCALYYSCSKSPVAVSLAGATVKAIAAGWNHSLALQSDNTVLAWGLNNYGQLGLGDTGNRPTPTLAVDGLTVKAIACGGAHSLAIKSDNAGIAWGLNNDGQLGVGTTDPFVTIATPVATNNALTAIAGGAFHSLAIQAGGAPLAWGYNATGQLGDGTTANRISPVSPLAPADSAVTGIAAGWAHSLFVK